MAEESFLLVRSDGTIEKSKSDDKIDTAASSFFAAIQNSPNTTGLTVLGGYAYINGNFVQLSDTVVDMGVSGNYQTSAIPAFYWSVALFSVDESGNLIMSQGNEPAALIGDVGIPEYPAGNLPIAQVYFQDNGLAGDGTINVIPDTSITDQRGFFYGSYGKSSTVSNLVEDLKVFAQSPANTQLVINPGSFYFSSGEYVPFAGATIDLGTGGGNQAPALPVGYYNYALVCLNHLGLIQIFYSTPASSINDVAIPTNGTDAFPLAIVTIQDNGGGIGGSLVPITSADILDARAFFNNFLGQVPATYLDYCRVKAYFPNSKEVLINSGVVYPKPALMIAFSQTTINFGSGPFQTPALPPGAYLRILLCLDAGGAPLTFLSSPEALESNLVNPPIPKTVVPLAYIDVQDDGSAIAGNIRPISDSNITDIRPWLGPAAAPESSPSPNSMYGEALLSSSFLQGFYEDFSTSNWIDLSNTTATVDTLVNNDATLAPGQTLQSTNIFDSYDSLITVSTVFVYATASDTSSNLQIQVSNDGINWNTVVGGSNNVYYFTTMGITLKVRFTNVGSGTITLNDYGVLYDDDLDSPSFLFANTRLPLNQVIDYGSALIVGNKLTLDQGRNYPIGEETLLVFKNGSLLVEDPTLTISPSYKENDMTSILLNPAPQPGDSFHLVIPAGLFGETVQEFQNTLNALVPSQYIVDQLVRAPSGGTTTAVQSAIQNLSLIVGGEILLDSQNFYSTQPIAVSGRDAYLEAKVHAATVQAPPSMTTGIFVISDGYDYSFTSLTIEPVSGFGTNLAGVQITSTSGSVAFTNCIFKNLNFGVQVTGNCVDLRFVDCQFINCTTDISAVDNLYVSNCVFNGSGSGTSGIVAHHYASILDSTFENKTGVAVTLTGTGNTVRSNTISAVSQGILSQSTTNESLISSNRVYSCTTTGIEVDGNRCAINGNILRLNQTGLLINGVENMIASNVITDNSVDGIVLGSSATDNQVSDNVLARNPT